MSGPLPAFAPDVERPRRWLSACPVYRATPLHRTATEFTPTLWIKDERERLGLGSFKALGGVYAVAALLHERWCAAGRSALDPAGLVEHVGFRAQAAEQTFVCASAGNHGLSVAAGARLFGARARIHLAGTVPAAFERRLRDIGADTVRSGAVYEEAVAAAIEDAAATGAIHLADGSWPGYWQPPALVMEGYTVIAEEMRETFEADGTWPTRVMLQAGVGGLAAAITHVIRARWAVQPEIVVVEPDEAPCLAESAAAGEPVTVEGPESVMGRLDCKAPSWLAVATLAAADVRYRRISDRVAEQGAAMLSELGYPTTPSGGAGVAALLGDVAAADEPTLVILSERAADDA